MAGPALRWPIKMAPAFGPAVGGSRRGDCYVNTVMIRMTRIVTEVWLRGCRNSKKGDPETHLGKTPTGNYVTEPRVLHLSSISNQALEQPSKY